MRNTIISIIIFLSLIFFVTYANNSLANLCDEIIDTSDSIEVMIDNKNWDEAYISSLDIIDKIENKNLLSSIYLNHCDFDNVLNEAIRLSVNIQSKNDSDSLVSANLLSNQALTIKDLHRATFKNIF